MAGETAGPAPTPRTVPTPKRKAKTERPWIRSGVTLGYWRGPVIWIRRTIHGRRYRVSTGARTSDAAWEEYKKFEADPAHYVPLTERPKAGGTSWGDAVVAFLKHKRDIEGRSEKYVDELAAQLDRWVKFLGPVSIDTFTQADVEAFLSALKTGQITGRYVAERDEHGNSIWQLDTNGNALLDDRGRRVPKLKLVPLENRKRDATRNRHLAALKSFMSWARDRDPPLTKNVADTKVEIGQEDQDTRPPEPVETAVWRAAGKNLMERWRMAQETLLGSGLRYGELARLKPEDIKPRGIVVRTAKRRKGRTVPVSTRTVRAATRLLELGGVPDDNGTQFDDRLEAACRAAGVKRYHPHHLRHTFGTVCLRNRTDIRTLQVWMGHAKITTTMLYLHALRAQDGIKGVPAPL